MKLYKMDEKKFAGYYSHHLSYALGNKLTVEEDFFRHVWQIVENSPFCKPNKKSTIIKK
ncbi:hypothetical protein [Pedobacter sp. KACC 23697]|uniref:Uncharacterized protein n=1 Tax=Pedobacter sp. KACC 23697 TaxID=3149230 RepID=A0AAU7K554_9SPHI